MKKFYLSISILLFSSLLTGCGMKGPLYQTPAAEKQIIDTKNVNKTEEKNSVSEQRSE